VLRHLFAFFSKSRCQTLNHYFFFFSAILLRLTKHDQFFIQATCFFVLIIQHSMLDVRCWTFISLTYSSFDVGRSMFDVHFFFLSPFKNFSGVKTVPGKIFLKCKSSQEIIVVTKDKCFFATEIINASPSEVLCFIRSKISLISITGNFVSKLGTGSTATPYLS